MSQNNLEIKIVDLDVGKTRQSPKAPGLRYMYLQLSENPPLEWVNFFEQQRAFPRHSMWRKAWIEGSYIVVDCVPDEIERFHLDDLKQDVSTANINYNQQIVAVRNAEQQRRLEEDAERDKLEELKSKLNFD